MKLSVRRPGLPLGVLLLSSLPLAGCGGDGAPVDTEGRPSLIFLSLDTLRQDRCSLYGYERETTPFLDELGAKSLVFDRAYATASWTLISHMTMFSGLYPAQHKVWEAEAALAESIPTLTQLLSDAGLRTAGVHFPGWLDDRFGFGRGYDDYRSKKDIDLAKEALDEMVPKLLGRSSFLFVHLFDIHSSSLAQPGAMIYDTPEPYDRMFDAEAPDVLADMDAKGVFYEIPETFTPRMREAVRGLYDGGIRHVDDEIRTWFEQWERDGLMDNAIVIITSDHGEGLALRQDRFAGHGNFFEEGLRVPLIVHATPKAKEWLEKNRGIDPAQLSGRSDALVSHVDLLPTVLDLLNIPGRLDYPGTSLLREIPDDRFIHAQTSDSIVSYRGSEKATYGHDGKLKNYTDLAENPGEDRQAFPLRGPRVKRARQFSAEAFAAASALPDPGAAASNGGLDAGSRAQLSELGYGAEVGERDR